MDRWARFEKIPCVPLGKNGTMITGSEEHIQLSRRAAAEGMVLLKNDNDVLPLARGARVALFGKASADYVMCGGGSGSVNCRYYHNLCDGMEIKASESKVSVYGPLNDFYRKEVNKQYDEGKNPGQTIEPALPEEILSKAAASNDVAIISICRFSAEGSDRTEDDFYLTEAERKMVKTVTDAFEKVIIVLNVGGIVDSSWFIDNPKIQGVLLAWQAGMEGGLAEADILCGDICPSGRLTDTFAAKLSDYPSSCNFNESKDYVEYTDDIFVGYRYFETIPGAAKVVNYPFGFGLSYTKFSFSDYSARKIGKTIEVSLKVTNTGGFEGKQVIQLYTSAPAGKLDKPALELKLFKKTDLLKQGEARNVYFKLDEEIMASYDEEKAAYILEPGEYAVYIGTSVRNVTKVFSYEIKEETLAEQLTNNCVCKKLRKRLRADGSYESLKTGEYKTGLDTTGWPKRKAWTYYPLLLEEYENTLPEDRDTLKKVGEGSITMEKLLSNFTDYQLIEMVGGKPNTTVTDTSGMGGLRKYGIPAVMTVDGPAGIRIHKEWGVDTTAWPCATLLACTWNTDMMYEIGAAAALEAKENNLAMWLAPALNIHRSPLCGRNFEYYSEDPVVSGKMAAAIVKGIQSQHISSCIKHFACNNKEKNRAASDSRVSERALREIYIKGFEIAVKEGKPWAIMTSYNLINGTYASENYDLLTTILRNEWKFDGLVTTDWENRAEQYLEVKAGNNIRMPYGDTPRIKKAYDMGLIKREDLEKNAYRVLQMILRLE